MEQYNIFWPDPSLNNDTIWVHLHDCSSDEVGRANLGGPGYKGGNEAEQ